MKKWGLSLFLISIIFSSLSSAIEINSLGARYTKGKLSLLNQHKLPEEEEWLYPKTTDEMCEIIHSLKVRGAPMIGLSAALFLAQLAEEGLTKDEIQQAAKRLQSTRPTAVNLKLCMDRVMQAISTPSCLISATTKAAEDLFLEDTALCQSIGQAGAALITKDENILTYCNTGSLATAGIGTALGVIKTAHAQGKNIHVYVCETRPLLQGGRLTTWELDQLKIPYTLICDNMVATLMQDGKVSRVLVGADRIALNGDFANKIGTYSLAILAKYHNVPFHVVAPYTTIDPLCQNGSCIQIEQRSAKEVQGIASGFINVRWSPKEAPVFNPAFDVTPSHLITSYVLDKGVLQLEQFKKQCAH